MKISLITPLDIKYSYKATEFLVYEYAKYLHDRGLDVELLVTSTKRKWTPNKGYKSLEKRYRSVPKRDVDCTEITLPLKYHLFIYNGLPRDSLLYLPFGIYQYLLNVVTKPKGQKYIIGCHGMHLKAGQLVAGSKALSKSLNSWLRLSIRSLGSESKSLYFHAVNMEQVSYLESLGVERRNIFYIPVMIDGSKYRVSSNGSKRLKVVHVGGEGKGSGVVAGTIKRLIDSGDIDKFEFYFVWHEQPDELKRYALSHKNLHLMGAISDEEKAKLLSGMDVMIVPAVETFSKAMIEGIASGLRIMASRRNPASLYVNGLGIDMTITNTGEPEEYVKPLLAAAKAKARLGSRWNTSKKSDRGIVIKNFDEKYVLPQILSMFKKVMDAKR